MRAQCCQFKPVSTHACSLMSRRRGSSGCPPARSRFNPRLLVDEQATLRVPNAPHRAIVSTHACSLMSRRPAASGVAHMLDGVSTHACSLMSRRLRQHLDLRADAEFQPTPAR